MLVCRCVELLLGRGRAGAVRLRAHTLVILRKAATAAKMWCALVKTAMIFTGGINHNLPASKWIEAFLGIE